MTKAQAVTQIQTFESETRACADCTRMLAMPYGEANCMAHQKSFPTDAYRRLRYSEILAARAFVAPKEVS
jgi:hypothetical protein